MVKPILTWNAAYKVCRGSRNLGFRRAKIVSAHLGCELDVFMDPAKIKQRANLEQALMDSGLVKPRT